MAIWPYHSSSRALTTRGSIPPRYAVRPGYHIKPLEEIGSCI